MKRTATTALLAVLTTCLTVWSVDAYASASADDEIIAAVVLERLRLGYLPSISGERDVIGSPLSEVCLGLPGATDPPPRLLRRFSRRYRITPLSQCARDAHRLIVGPIRRLGRSAAEVEWSGLGNAGAFLLERRRGKWRVRGAIGGIVGCWKEERPPNNEMQTKRSWGGASLLISVFGGHRSWDSGAWR
jgi:hypothetical protein